MAIVITDDKHYSDIAAAIRSKNGGSTKYKPEEMAAAINAIEGGSDIELVSVTVTPTDEEQTITPDAGKAFNKVIVEAAEVGSGETAKTTVIDYSNYASGTFTETLDTGEDITYNVILDSEGKPTQITSDGGVSVAVEW